MNQASSPYGSFKDMERDGWQERAPHYHHRLAQMTKQATPYMLDAVGAAAGMRLLDICCGPGHAGGEAAAPGPGPWPLVMEDRDVENRFGGRPTPRSDSRGLTPKQPCPLPPQGARAYRGGGDRCSVWPCHDHGRDGPT